LVNYSDLAAYMMVFIHP